MRERERERWVSKMLVTSQTESEREREETERIIYCFFIITVLEAVYTRNLQLSREEAWRERERERL